MSAKSLGRWAIDFTASTMRKWERLVAVAALGLAAFGVTDRANAGQMFTGQFGTGNTWNLYEAISSPFSFKEALAVATTRLNPVGGAAVGHLVTLSSLAENNFVHSTAGGGDRWIGLTDRFGAAPGATESAFLLDPLTQGWAWVTGEPFSFQNWSAGEPNNAGAGEDAVHLGANTMWNDNASGFGDDDPVVDPEGGSTAEPATGFGFIIEWSTNLAAQPPGFPMTRPDPPSPPISPIVFPTPLARLPGPNGTASSFGVRDFLGLGASADTRAAVDNILSGAATTVDGTAARLDITDPGFGTNQGSVPATQVPIPSDTPLTDDDNFQEVVKGTFVVPAGQGGDYTFNVRSDDGFAMRVLSQATPASPLVQHKFTNSRNGRTDTDGTLVFLAPTGDSNTQGVINLAPGTYDVEYLWFENGGGAFAEVSTQKGDFIANTPANTAPNWILLGDGSSLPQVGPFLQAARLVAPAAVQNFDMGVDVADVVTLYRGGPIFTAEGTADDVVLNGDGGLGIHGNTVDPSQVHQFPNGTGLNNFSTAVTGEFTVLDTNGALGGETLTFGLFADDNAAIHIVGQSFTGAGGGGTLANPEGLTDQWLVADFRTGDTNAFGSITLPEGSYDFEAFHLEDGGGAALEVFVAAGDRASSGFNTAFFLPLTIDSLTNDTVLAANTGLALVAGPGTGPPAGQAGDFDGDGDVDGRDFLVWQRGGSPTPLSPADLATWKANYGAGAASGAGGAVPEPGALCLVAMAVAGVAAGRTRRRS